MNGFFDGYRKVAFGILLLIAFALGLALLLPFVPALLWATVLSVLTWPIYRRSRDAWAKKKWCKIGMAENIASLWTTLLTLFIVCIPFLAIGTLLLTQIKTVSDNMDPKDHQGQTSYQQMLKGLDDSLSPVAASLGIADFKPSQYLEENRQDIVVNLRAPVTKALSTAAFTLLTIVIALLTMFFLLRDAEKLREPALQLIPLPRESALRILQRVADTIRAVFVGTVLVAIIQGAVIGITYFIVGVPAAPLLGIISMMLCVIPLLGAPVIYVPVGLWLLMQGKVGEAIAVLGVGFLIVSQIDNLLKPFLIGNKVSLHPMAVFFSIFGGVLLIGPIGLMAGPMILTICIGLVDVIRERLLLTGDVAEPAL